MPNISAASVPGRIGSHSTPGRSGMSPRMGEILTMRIPARLARCSHSAMSCVPAPPAVTWPLRNRMPPKQTTMRAWSTMSRHSTTGPTIGSFVPTMCGNSVIPAA